MDFGLNDIEIEVAKLLCEGMSAAEIAAAIYRSEWTVNGYRESIRLKTHSRNMVQAIAKLFNHGILKANQHGPEVAY